MIDIGGITMKELTEYADYCMGKIPVEDRVDFPNNGRGTVNVVQHYTTPSGVEYPVIETSLKNRSFVVGMCDFSHRLIMAARIWLNTGHIYLLDWNSARTLYNKPPYGIETFEEFKERIALPVVPKGILKIPSKL